MIKINTEYSSWNFYKIKILQFFNCCCYYYYLTINWNRLPFTKFLLLRCLNAIKFWINSGILAVIHVRSHSCLSSHLLLEFLSSQNPAEIELLKLKIGFAWFELSIYKTNLTNPILSFSNSISTGFWLDRNSRRRWEERQGRGTGLDHSQNYAVHPEFRDI